MDSFQYSIIYNNELVSQNLARKLQTKLKKYQTKESNDKPNVVFIIGGDGTFLKALNQYNQQLNEIKFIAFKQGNIGFYHSFNITDMDQLLDSLFKKEQVLHENYFDLLEITANQKKWFAINEFRLINMVQTISFDVYLNELSWESFRGSGIIVSTKSGAAGLMKTTGGSLLLSSYPLMELQEIFPVNNNFYRTIKTPIVLDNQYCIKIKFPQNWEESNKYSNFVIDTFLIRDKLSKEITIKIANQKVTTLSFEKNQNFLIDKIKMTFMKV